MTRARRQPDGDGTPLVGLGQWFRRGEHDRVERALADLRTLGVHRLRTGLSWADWCAPDGEQWFEWFVPKLAAQVEDLSRHPECGGSYTGARLQNEKGRGAQWVGGRWTPFAGWILDRVLSIPGLIVMPAVMLERRLFDGVGGFDESFPVCEDLDLWVRLAEASPATVVAEPLVNVRQHLGNRPTRSVLPLICLNRIYGRVLARTTSPRVRRLCRRQRIRVSLNLAGRLRREGWYAGAWEALRIAFPYAGWHPRWWIGLLKTTVSAATPRDRGR